MLGTEIYERSPASIVVLALLAGTSLSCYVPHRHRTNPNLAVVIRESERAASGIEMRLINDYDVINCDGEYRVRTTDAEGAVAFGPRGDWVGFQVDPTHCAVQEWTLCVSGRDGFEIAAKGRGACNARGVTVAIQCDIASGQSQCKTECFNSRQSKRSYNVTTPDYPAYGLACVHSREE